MANGDCYEGQYENGMRHGLGNLTEKKTGKQYEGQFIEGKIEGYGIMKLGDGQQFKGEWKDGNMEGIGEIIYPNSILH